MSALAKSLSLSTFNRGNLVVVAMVLASVLALFFLPEIIDLKRAISGAPAVSSAASSGAVTKSAASEPAATIAVERREAVYRVRSTTSVSPLDEVLLLLEERNEPRASASISALRAEASRKVAEVMPSSEEPESGASDALDALSARPLTWTAIQSDGSKKALRKARAEALDLAQSLSTRNASTRYALFNFASGIGFALDPKAAKVMKPEEAVGYLERLDRAVSHSMSRESVDRLDYLAWANISLGPVFQATRLGRRELPTAPPFDPELTISSLHVLHTLPDDPERRRQEEVNVHLTGFVRGKDARVVKLIDQNGRVRRRIKLRKAKSDTDYRFFKSSRIDGRQTWTIVVEGEGDQIYSKVYRFYDRALPFGWGRLSDVRANGYQVPFRNVRATAREFNPSLVDPRLDAHFHVGGMELRTASGFQTF